MTESGCNSYLLIDKTCYMESLNIRQVKKLELVNNSVFTEVYISIGYIYSHINK